MMPQDVDVKRTELSLKYKSSCRHCVAKPKFFLIADNGDVKKKAMALNRPDNGY
jgi:hypothetical protein